ncbi:dTMP kinase [Candidatus Levibacter sp. Uisw_134_01]|uniref:dTMP kinase n=1 Tax=Candidatus Levibacter sp. Uisw_134_01 TaxID=3230999 RepID=UPI003D4732CD
MSNNYYNKSKKGLFISFEGGEGVGKSTQIELLKTSLTKKKINVLSTREPGGTKEGELIRKFLVSGEINSWDTYSESLLFNALRREHINKIINPSLFKGDIVLCDRFIDSTIVYQGVGGAINQTLLLSLHKNFCYDLYPDITFFLSLDPKVGLDRTLSRNNKTENRFENMGLLYHQKIQDGFKALSDKNNKRFFEINAELSVEKISNQIYDHVISIIKSND